MMAAFSATRLPSCVFVYGWLSGDALPFSELVLDNLCQHILDVESGSLDLLWYERCRCHAWGGVYLEHVDMVCPVSILRYDIVYAQDAIGMEYIVYGACYLCDSLGCLPGYARWGYLCHLSVVLRVIVEELILCNHLCRWQHDALRPCLVASLAYLHSVEESLYHDGV